MYTREERTAIYKLGKRLWDKAWEHYDRSGPKPALLMELARELAPIAILNGESA